MKVSEIVKALSLETIYSETDREITGVYAGDLLSRAVSHVKSGNIWLTIMTNKNVVAVASLSDAAAVILAEGTTLTEDALESAEEFGITVLSSPRTIYELCSMLSSLMQ